MPVIKTLILQFANELSTNDITKFRGAVIASLKEKNILYHNHIEDRFRYAYPLIQYKRIHQKAAIVCIGDGVKAIHELFASDNFLFKIGEKETEMKMDNVKVYDNEISIFDTIQYYRIRNWLPLNSENYAKFQNADSLVERIQILERILAGNMLSFLKGIDIHLEEQMELHITSILDQRPAIYKRVKLMSFDIEFKTNLYLPQYIGIGKNASIGCGVLTKKQTKY
jgi:hypothetical protein